MKEGIIISTRCLNDEIEGWKEKFLGACCKFNKKVGMRKDWSNIFIWLISIPVQPKSWSMKYFMTLMSLFLKKFKLSFRCFVTTKIFADTIFTYLILYQCQITSFVKFSSFCSHHLNLTPYIEIVFLFVWQLFYPVFA
jgi:hypothetical protein